MLSRRSKGKQRGIGINGTHQLLVYADNLLRKNTIVIKKNTEALLGAGKEVGL
jgi:hypothetical protein